MRSNIKPLSISKKEVRFEGNGKLMFDSEKVEKIWVSTSRSQKLYGDKSVTGLEFQGENTVSVISWIQLEFATCTAKRKKARGLDGILEKIS